MAHILLPTDLSDDAMQASAYAARLFGTVGNTFTVLHAYMDVDPSMNAWPNVGEELYKASVEGLEVWAGRLRALPEMADAALHVEVAYGLLPDVLNEFATDRNADLVVMGTQGASGADFLGSNAGAVVKHSRIPVLVVPGRSGQGPVRRILFADDEREMEPRDLRMLLDVARRTRAEVLLTHVLTDLEEVPDEALVAEYGELFRDIPHRFTTGEGKDVAAAIDLLADKEGADMVAVMHRHTGFLEGLFHISTAKRLALHTHIPLLVLQKDRN